MVIVSVDDGSLLTARVVCHCLRAIHHPSSVYLLLLLLFAVLLFGFLQCFDDVGWKGIRPVKN